jgi:hypothetical protein
MRDLAQQLLAAQAASTLGSQSHVDDAVQVCDKLRVAVRRFAGADGFTALLRRALALARTDVPALHALKVNPDGSLEGIEQVAADARERDSGCDAGAEGRIAITAHLW